MSRFFDRAAIAIERRLLACMEVMRDQTKERIGIPVDKSTKPWTRSKPGEAPRKDKGNLQASASAQVINATLKVQASVAVTTPYAKPLSRTRDIYGSILSNNRKAIVDAVRGAIVTDTKGQ